MAFPSTSEQEVKLEFNHLLSQFKAIGKYVASVSNRMIPEEEDISYEMRVHDKRYQASFSYFIPNHDNDLESGLAFLDRLTDFFTDRQRSKLQESAREIAGLQDSEWDAYIEKKAPALGKELFEDADLETMLRYLQALSDNLEDMADGRVWFRIHERYGHFWIGLYYDNLHNQAHGEDL